MSLRPATLNALAAFRQRRTRLLLIHATLLGLALWLTLCLAIALLDRATFMPDALRKTLGYGAWIAAIATFLHGAARLLWEHRHPTALARLMETADPTLREKLLAAIELSDEAHASDSAEFRGRLQEDVAVHLQTFNPLITLPTRLLTPAIRLVSIIVLTIIGLAFVPALHLPGFIARATFPFANIGRPSSISIRILTPEKPDLAVPFSSQTPVAVQIDGPTPPKVIIEQQTADAKPSRFEMTDVGQNRFESTLHVEQTSVRYRILAADAITAWHTLEATPRPRILQFAKTITPPAYTQLPPQILTEDHGDITALEGSSINLVLTANQPLQNADALLLPSQTPLSLGSPTPATRQLAFPLDGASNAWQIRLSAEKTGFTSDDNTSWRLQTLPDLPPVVTLTSPQTNLQVQPDQSIAITGAVHDDLGLAKVELSHAVNGADWQSQDLPLQAGVKETAVETTLPLAKLPLHPGDALLIKLVATDSKGQRSESPAARLLIVTDQPDLTLRTWAATQRQISLQADALMREARQARKQTEQLRDHPADADSQAARANLKQNLSTLDELAEQLWTQLKQAARQAPNALEQHEINLAGQHLARLRNEHVPAFKQQAADTSAETREIRKTANETAAAAETFADALRVFARADLAESAKESLEQLAPRQQRLAEKAIDANRDSAQRPRWQEQQRAAIAAANQARTDLEALHGLAPEHRQREIQNHINNLGEKSAATETALDTPEQHQAPEFLYGQAHELRNAANQTRDMTRNLAEEAQNKAVEMRERLQQQPNAALAALNQAQEQLQRAAGEKNPDKKNQAAREASARLQTAAAQFQAQSELREQNTSTNTLAALDQNRLSRALDKLAAQIPSRPENDSLKPLQQQLKQLQETARTLEADAIAQDAGLALDQGLNTIQADESPQRQVAAATAAQSQLKPLERLLQRANAAPAAIQAAQRARDQAERQRHESRAQAQNAAAHQQNQQPPPSIPDAQNPALDANRQARQQLTEALNQFAPQTAAARSTLEALTPKLSELAQDAAGQLRETQRQTDRLAAATATQTPEQTASQTQSQLMPEAQQDARQLADLQAALRQESAHASLTDAAALQMARAADVGLAQMQQQTPQIAASLQQAAQSTQSNTQQQALQKAAQAQQQTADALTQLSQNLTRMEQGQTLPGDALAAQQAMEEALGIKKPLDESYQGLDEINKLMEQARDQPQQTLAALEKELQSNPTMQQALGSLALKTAQDSAAALEQTQSQPQLLPTAAPAESHALARVARHQQRLSQTDASSQIANASKQLDQLAKAETNTANAQTAGEAAKNAAATAAQTSQSLKAPTPASLFQTAKAAMLAQALDQLDQALHPKTGDNQDTQAAAAAQAGQTQQQQAAAQQSLSSAAQAQAGQMAQARAQGQVPGQSPPSSPSAASSSSQANAQATSNQNQGQPSPDPSGNWSQTAANLNVPLLGVQQDGDWGRLPARMAKDLTEAARQEPSPEYREAIENYYKAIAEKSRQ